MIMTGLARLGRDTSLKYTPDGTAVCELALAFNYGRKNDEGNRPTQWVDAALFGKRAEALQPYLTKGSLICVIIDAPHIETWEKKDGNTGFKLVGRVIDIELAGGNQSTPKQEPKPEPKPAQKQSAAFDDFDDEIPF